jgi:hypothetical protein
VGNQKDRGAGAHGSQGTEESCRLNKTIIAYWYSMSMITCKWFGCCGIAVLTLKVKVESFGERKAEA